MVNFPQSKDSRQLQKGSSLVFEESNESQYSSLDYLILRQLGKVMEFANNLHLKEYQIGFINSVHALHQIAQFYWMYDENYKQGVKLIIQWKKTQLKDWTPGDDVLEIDVPMFFVEVQSTKKDNKTTEYELIMETEGVKEITVQELNVIEAKLLLNLLMEIITKRQKTRDIEDSY